MASTVLWIDGVEYDRVRFGEERDREDSPCPGCGAYYLDVHEFGCDIEECPKHGTQLISCGCVDAPKPG